MNVLVYIVLRV